MYALIFSRLRETWLDSSANKIALDKKQTLKTFIFDWNEKWFVSFANENNRKIGNDRYFKSFLLEVATMTQIRLGIPKLSVRRFASSCKMKPGTNAV